MLHKQQRLVSCFVASINPLRSRKKDRSTVLLGPFGYSRAPIPFNRTNEGRMEDTKNILPNNNVQLLTHIDLGKRPGPYRDIIFLPHFLASKFEVGCISKAVLTQDDCFLAFVRGLLRSRHFYAYPIVVVRFCLGLLFEGRDLMMLNKV